MGAPLTEIIIEQCIRYGLQELRDKPSRIDMIFESMLMTALKTNYGQKEIESVKAHIASNKIAVVQAWPLIAEKVPCYSINITGTSEMPNRAFFSDEAGHEATIADPVQLAVLNVTAYDPVTGFVTVPDGTDLSAIYVGAILIDSASNQFEILGSFLNIAGMTGFAIAVDATIVLGSCIVLEPPVYDIAPKHATPLYETIQIGVHAGENTNLCKYMYYMLLYFLQSRRLELENVGIQLHTFTVTDFVKLIDFLPNNILNRFVNMTAMVWFSWKEDPFAQLVRTGMSVKVEKDVFIERGDYTLLTTDGTEPVD